MLSHGQLDFVGITQDQYLFINQEGWKKHIDEFLIAFNQIAKEIRDN